MRAAEFMRSLADIIDALDGGESNGKDNKTPMEKGNTFVPPLQQKIEIMKKMADIPSSSKKFNQIAADEDEPTQG